MKRYGIPLLLAAGTAAAGVDYQCLSDCTDRNYSYAYCKQACTVYEPPRSVRPASPMDAFIRGREARQAEEARELELQRLRAEQARREQEAAERARLEAEKEALRQELERLKAEKRQE